MQPSRIVPMEDPPNSTKAQALARLTKAIGSTTCGADEADVTPERNSLADHSYTSGGSNGPSSLEIDSMDLDGEDSANGYCELTSEESESELDLWSQGSNSIEPSPAKRRKTNGPAKRVFSDLDRDEADSVAPDFIEPLELPDSVTPDLDELKTMHAELDIAQKIEVVASTQLVPTQSSRPKCLFDFPTTIDESKVPKFNFNYSKPKKEQSYPMFQSLKGSNKYAGLSQYAGSSQRAGLSQQAAGPSQRNGKTTAALSKAGPSQVTNGPPPVPAPTVTAKRGRGRGRGATRGEGRGARGGTRGAARGGARGAARGGKATRGRKTAKARAEEEVIILSDDSDL